MDSLDAATAAHVASFLYEDNALSIYCWVEACRKSSLSHTISIKILLDFILSSPTVAAESTPPETFLQAFANYNYNCFQGGYFTAAREEHVKSWLQRAFPNATAESHTALRIAFVKALFEKAVLHKEHSDPGHLYTEHILWAARDCGCVKWCPYDRLWEVRDPAGNYHRMSMLDWLTHDDSYNTHVNEEGKILVRFNDDSLSDTERDYELNGTDWSHINSRVSIKIELMKCECQDNVHDSLDEAYGDLHHGMSCSSSRSLDSSMMDEQIAEVGDDWNTEPPQDSLVSLNMEICSDL